MQQPSAQGIASLFRGNPAPLQQRIQQEQQGKPGLPPDLQKLLALNIVTNEKDAVAKQQAMSQLAQMQGPQGQPPTVMESVQEQARQKMQAQAMQAQRQQQAMQAMARQAGPGPVPEGTQFAEAQPTAQGIDDLPVEFGLAGGGIVAFQEGKKVPRIQDEVPISEEERERLQQELLMRIIGEEARNPPAPKRPPMEITESDLSSIPGMEPSDLMARELRKNEPKPQSEYGRQMGEVGNLIGRGAKAVGRAIDKVVPDPVELVKTLVSAPGSASPFAVKEAAPQATPAPQAAASYSNEGRTGARPYTPKPVSDLKALAEADARKKQAARPPAPVAQAPAPTAPAPTASIAPPQSEADRILNERLMQDPTVAAANKEMMYQSRVGAPDTTQRDAMIKQLQEERARQVGPQDSFGQLMEYLGQIAATPRGMSSFEAGAAGARGVRGLEEQRAQKRFDLGSKIIEQEQGKIDASRQYAKEVYGVGEKEYDQIFKAQYEAAKQISGNEMEARKMAQQETLKLMELKQEADLSRERMKNNLSVANIGQEGRRADEQRNQQYLNLAERARKLREAGDTAGADRVQAQANDILTLKGGTGTAGVGAGRNKIMERRQSMTELEKIIKDEGMVYSEADKASAAREYRRLAMLNVQEGEGAATGGGKPITKAEYDKLPKGATYTAPDGTQRTKG
jgi:hypothetical protein